MEPAKQAALPGMEGGRRLPLRPWMPPAWQRAVAGQVVELRIPDAVRRRCKKPTRIPPSEWNLRYRRMPAADAHPGAYRPEFARYAAQVMDTWAQPWVREVWFCGVDQASKTNTMLACLGWSIDQAPGNVFYQMPNKDASDRIMGKKLNPMLTGSPRLAVHVSPRADDTALSGTTLTNGVAIIPSYSGSLSSTATFSAKYTFSDEVDKMETVGKEADPITRIRKRIRTKRFGKNFFASTPAGKWIHTGTTACVQVWEAAARCPHCGDLVVMHEDLLDIPEGATVDSIKADPGSIGYMCNACGERWEEADRQRAYDRGGWVCTKGADAAKPVDVGFILSAFPLPDVPLADIAQVVVRAQGGDLSARRDLAHGIKAVDFQDVHVDRKEDAILRLCDDRPAGKVHPESDVLTASFDTQDHGFWYTIRGWRYGEDLKSWLVKAGYLPAAHPSDFSGPDQILDASYHDANARAYRISYAIIDTQGHRTAEVYQWCKRSGAMAARGAQGRKVQPVTVSKVEHYPGSNRAIPGGLQLYHLDTHFHKDVLANKLQIDPSDPGAWVLHCGYSALQLLLMEKSPGLKLASGLEDYAKHLCVEVRDERSLWVNPQKKPEHLWDCEQQQIALALYLGFQNLAPDPTPPEPPPQPQTANAAGTSKPSWFHNRRR